MNHFLFRSHFIFFVTLAALLMCYGCETGQVVGSAAGVTWVGAQAPGNEIQQIYYLGVFDPHEQVPPQVYRITVRGQASAFSGVKYSSGWVHAS
ncbi:hypothetical protein GF373_17305, partial [bacterium]|nr:hypothetical protein [bacterium]